MAYWTLPRTKFGLLEIVGPCIQNYTLHQKDAVMLQMTTMSQSCCIQDPQHIKKNSTVDVVVGRNVALLVYHLSNS